MAKLTWLHLSDWHQQGKDFNRQMVRDALREDLLNRASISPDLAKIDFLVFSGDIAFSGQAEEYSAAIEFLFKPVLEATELSPDRLFIVPGNHDLDRKKFRYLPVEIKQPFESEAQVQDWLADDENRTYMLSPFAAYQQFASKYTDQEHPAYASILRLAIDGKQIALLGLNSALMCGRNINAKGEVEDYGYLVVGEPQLHDALKQIVDADLRIAVLHHPFEWLAGFDRTRVKEPLGQKCHFILCGHQHMSEVNAVQGTAGDCLLIPAGASYDRRVAHDARFTNAYNLVHLDLEAAQGTVYLRQWNDRQSIWIADTYSRQDGQFKFRLPKDLGHPLSPSSKTQTITSQAVLASSQNYEQEKRIIEGYLRALISHNADLEPGGIKQTGIQVVLPLDEIYIGLQANRDRPDVDRRVMQVELDEIKKRLDAEEDPEEREKQYQIWAQQARPLQQALELTDSSREELASIIQRHRQLVILGDPGSGKTTLLRYLALRFAQVIMDDLDRIFQPQDLRDNKNVWQLPDLGPVRLPILIRISHYAEARQKDHDLALLDYLPRYFAGLQVPDTDKLGALLRRLLDEGRCLILLDGLDEIVDPTDRLNIATAIGQFTGVYREKGLPEWLPHLDDDSDEGIMQLKGVPENVRLELEKRFEKRLRSSRAHRIAWDILHEARYAHVGNCFVITSRIAGYHSAVVPGDFEHYTICPMSMEDITLFLEKWCPTVEWQIAKEPDPVQVEQRARKEIEGILQAINTPGVRRMAENPLLLRILALIHRTHSHLPQRRVELYETATITLLRDWNLQRGLGKEVTIGEHDAMALLGPIALLIHERYPSGLLSKGVVEVEMGRILAHNKGDDPENPSLEVKIAVEVFLNKVRQYSGLFVERGEGLFGFMHLTFEEYFTARQLTSDLDRAREEILSRLHLPRWREPILLAIGRLSSQFYDSTDSLLQAILDHGINDLYEGALHRNLLFAATCVGDSVSVYPRRRKQIAERLLSLYCEHLHASRFRLLKKQIKDALLFLSQDLNNVPVEAALAAVLSRCANDPSNLSRAFEMVEWLQAHTLPVAQALATCDNANVFPLLHQLRRDVQSRLESHANETIPIPKGWEAYRNDAVLARFLGAMWHFGWRNALETALNIPPVDGINHRQWGLQQQTETSIPSLSPFPENSLNPAWSPLLEEENTDWSRSTSDLELLSADTEYSQFTTADWQSSVLKPSQLNSYFAGRENLIEDLEGAGNYIIRNAQSGDAIVSFFVDRANLLISLQPVPNVDALRASVKFLQTDLVQALLQTLLTTNNSQCYYGAAFFLVCTSEELTNETVSIIFNDLKGTEVRRRWALQMLSELIFRKHIKFSDVQYTLLIDLLEGPINQANLALDILFEISLTSELLAWCWSALSSPNHPLSDTVTKKLGEMNIVEGTTPILDLLDRGRSNPILRLLVLELLHKVDWQGTETFSHALTWLLDEDSAVRHHAAILLSKQEDLSTQLRTVFLEATREQQKAVQPSPAEGWAAQRHNMQVVRLLSGLWLHNWDDILTKLFVGQSKQIYMMRERPYSYMNWKVPQTYPECEDFIIQLLDTAEFGQQMIPFFQEAARELVEVEHETVGKAPTAEHIATVMEAVSSRWVESPYVAGLLPVSALRRFLAKAEHPLTRWISDQLARRGLHATSAPVTLAPLLNDTDASIRTATALTLLIVDLPTLLLQALFEAAQSSDDRVRNEGENSLYDLCSRLLSDGSSEALDWLIDKSLVVTKQESGYIVSLILTALGKVTFTNVTQVSDWLVSEPIRKKPNLTEANKFSIRIANASPEVVSLLCTYMKDVNKSQEVRGRALNALYILRRGNTTSRSDTEITATLVTGLSDPAAYIRRRAAYTLQWVEEQDLWAVAESLLKTAQTDTDPQTRVCALWSLGRLLYTIQSTRDIEMSKEALFDWLGHEASIYGWENVVRKAWDQSSIQEASNTDMVLEQLSHFDLGLLAEPNTPIIFQLSEQMWKQMLTRAQEEWKRRSLAVETLPKLSTAIAVIEALLATADSAIRRGAACAVARIYQGNDARPTLLYEFLNNDTAVLWAMVDAATIPDHQWDINHENSIKQIAKWVEEQQSIKRARLIDALLDELAEQITLMERENWEEVSEIEAGGYRWFLCGVLTFILSELSERLTYSAFIHNRSLTEVIHRLVQAARNQHSYMVRQFAIRALGNLQQFTTDVAEIFFEACQDVDEVYKEAQTAVTKFKYFGPGSLEKLTSAMRNPNTIVAYHAAILLGKLGVTRTEELGSAKRKLIADQLISILDDELSKRIIHDIDYANPALPLYDVIYESLVQVVAGRDAELTFPTT